MKIGYARVSTKDQNLDRQIALLEKEGCDKIYSEKASGKNTYLRPKLQEALASLSEDDVLIVAEWDRATRSYEDGFKIVGEVAKKKATIKVLDRAYLDLTSPIGKAVLGLLSAWAEDERVRRNAQAAQGRKHAQKRGVVMGRKPVLSAYQRDLVLTKLGAGETVKSIAEHFGVGTSTIHRVKKKHCITQI